MPFDLKKIPNILNQITIALFFIGLYLTIQHPSFYIGKQTLFSQSILPLYTIIIFINSLLILSLKEKIQLIPQNKLQLSLLLFLSCTTLFSIFLTLGQTITFFSLILFFYNLKFSPTIHLQKNLYYSTIIVSIIAITQFMTQSDLNLQFFGEPLINSNIKGIAKLNHNIIRAYGLFQHPNILAGILVLTSFINPFSKNNKTYAAQYLALILTFSLNSILALSSKHIKNVKQFILFTLVTLLIFISIKSPDFLIERINQLVSLIHSSTQAKPWDIQPIHNTFILSLQTYGPIHLLSLSWLIYQTYKSQKEFSIALIILISFDHFFLTSYQALPLLVTLIYIISQTDFNLIHQQKQTKTLEN